MPITRKPLLIASLSLSLALGASAALAQGCGAATDRCPADGSAQAMSALPIAVAARSVAEACAALPLRMAQWLLPGAAAAPRPGVE